jgi:hypothetical protein
VQRRALVLVVAVACSQPSRPRDDEPAHGARPAVVAAVTPDAAAGPAPASDAASAAAAGPAPASDAASAAPAGDAAPGGEVAGAASDAPPIVDAPMAWSAERERLTLAYRRQHSDPDAADLVIDPRVIVLHYTAGGSAAGTRRYFDNVRIEAVRKQLAAAGAVNVSAHFIVDRDGTIYQLQPPTRFARHCIGLNHLAIGIENVGDEAAYPLTDAQVAADAALVRMLARRYRITHLLGHQEVMKFRDHPYYVERDAGYKNDKPDPGRRFMALVRARVADLGLRGL